MQRAFKVLIVGLAVFIASSAALNTIKGNLFVNEQLRIKEIVIDPSQAQFTPNFHLQSAAFIEEQEEEQQNDETQQLSEHQQKVDEAASGIIANNVWCEQCQINNIRISEKLIGDNLNVNIISGKKDPQNASQDGVITILGDLIVSDKESETESSNLNINLVQTKTVSINGVKQWSLLDSESFSFTNSQTNSTLLQNGWKVIKADTSSQPLKTNEDELALASLNEKISKQFEDLPEHTHVKIEGNFYFLSPFWKGESAQIRVNGKIVWLDSHKWTDNMISGIEDICQFNVADFNQYVWVQPISFVFKHRQESFEIELGLTKTISEILQCKDNQNKLDQIPLFGFDDFSLYIK